MSCKNCGPIDVIISTEPETETVDVIFSEPTVEVRLLNSQDLVAAPQPPANLTVVEARITEVDLDWDDTDTDSYTVYVQNTATGITEQTITSIVLSETTVTGLTEETEYEFWVISVRDNIESTESNHITTTTLSEAEPENTYSLSFDGIDDIVTVADVHSVNNNSQTWMCWFKTSATADTFRLIDKRGQGSFGENFPGFQLSGKITPDNWENVALQDTEGNVVGGLNFQTAGIPNDGEWHHVAVVWDNSTGTLKLYVDFTEVESDTNSNMIGADCTTTRELSFGAANTLGQFFEGNIDEIQIWNKVLTEAEVEENANKILEGTEDGLLGYWNCEDEEATLTDLTSNNNHGTINGAVYVEEAFTFS